MAFLPNIGLPELAILLVIVILILGPKRIPAAAKSVGQGMRNFKVSLTGGSDDDEKKSEEAKAGLEEPTGTDAKAQAKTKSEA